MTLLTSARSRLRTRLLLPLALSGLLAGGPGGPALAADAADGTSADAQRPAAVATAPARLDARSVRTDRTAVGRAEPTMLGLAQLVPPARVVEGRTLAEKPPPWQLPVQGARLTARFGQTGLWASAHTGLDFAAPEGTPLVAVGRGVVESAGYDGAFGQKVVLRLEDGTRLWYCHLSVIGVSPGQRVGAGDAVGALGSTGHVTGPHLHLEVHPAGGAATDPAGWLAERGLL